jgi:hypothetical protein
MCAHTRVNEEISRLMCDATYLLQAPMAVLLRMACATNKYRVYSDSNRHVQMGSENETNLTYKY